MHGIATWTYSAILYVFTFFGTKKLREALGYDPTSNKVGEVIALRGTAMTKMSEIIPKANTLDTRPTHPSYGGLIGAVALF